MVTKEIEDEAMARFFDFIASEDEASGLSDLNAWPHQNPALQVAWAREQRMELAGMHCWTAATQRDDANDLA